MNQLPSISALRAALPYIRLFRGQLFVIKCGGEVLDSASELKGLIEQIGLLHELGIKVILVHGGGVQSNELAAKLGVETRFVDGRRVTSPEALATTVMAINGTARTAILSAFRELGIGAAGISGMDDGLIRADRRPPIQTSEGTVDFGEVGTIREVQGRVLQALLAEGLVPVVSPISANDEGAPLNLNADGVASAIAAALGAQKLIFVTKPRGILADPAAPHTLFSQLSLRELGELEKDGTVHTGMLPKASAIRDALVGGVEQVHVISYAYPDALLTEIFTNEGCGTMIVAGDA